VFEFGVSFEDAVAVVGVAFVTTVSAVVAVMLAAVMVVGVAVAGVLLVLISLLANPSLSRTLFRGSTVSLDIFVVEGTLLKSPLYRVLYVQSKFVALFDRFSRFILSAHLSAIFTLIVLDFSHFFSAEAASNDAHTPLFSWTADNRLLPKTISGSVFIPVSSETL